MSEHVQAVAPIHHAATVLLLRESDAGLQVLMTKRAAGLSFMAGLWVFPGGRMEPSDQSPEVTARVPAAAVAAAHDRMLGIDGRPLEREAALALHVAACRETFEEAGLLLARPSGGNAECDEGQIARLGVRRAEATDAAGFVRLLVEEDLVLDVGRLVYWSHWITPSQEKKRFDTRFFAIQMPPGQEASVDRSELTQHAWLTEADVRTNMNSGEMKMAPPTIATLQDLWSSHARHGGIDAMLEAERRRLVPPILPKLIVDEGSFQTILPWDAEYARIPGESCAVWESYPEYLLALPSRRAFKR